MEQKQEPTPPDAQQPGTDDHELARAEGEGMTGGGTLSGAALAPSAAAAAVPSLAVSGVAQAAAQLSVADRLAAGETLEVDGIKVKQYDAPTGKQDADAPTPEQVAEKAGFLDMPFLSQQHSTLIDKVVTLAHHVGISLDDNAHGLMDSLHAHVQGLEKRLQDVAGQLYRAKKVQDVLAASHEPVADGVYDSTASGFREWYVGDKLQIGIAKDTLDFLGNSVPMNLRGKWGTKPDMPSQQAEQAAIGHNG